jgi:hypothetical protein
MANIIDNAITSYSLILPDGAYGVSGAAKSEGTATAQTLGSTSQFVRPAAAETRLGWLPVGTGENVDLMA